MGESLLILSRSLGYAAFAEVIRSPNEASMELLVRLIRHGVGLLVCGAAALLVFGAVLFEPLFGKQFAGILLPLAILVPGIIALGTAEAVRLYFLVRLERTREYMTTVTLSMIINLVVAVALVPPLGLAGAALSTSLSYIIGAIYLFEMFRREGAPRLGLAYLPRRADFADYGRLIRSIVSSRAARRADVQ